MSTIFRDQVGVEDFLFNTKVRLDGAMFNCDLLDGWDDTPQPTVVIGQFTYSDGVTSADRFPLKEKYIEVGGWVHTTSRVEAEKAKSRLRGMFSPNKIINLVRYGPIPVRYSVRATSSVEFPQDIGREGFRWLVQVMADWPFRLGLTEKGGLAGVFTGSGFYRDYPSGTGRKYEYNATKGTYYRTYKADLSGNGDLVATIERINNAINPRAATITNWGWQPGTDEVSSTEVITGAADGPLLPDGSRITSYVQRTITTGKSAGNSGWYYRSAPGEQVLAAGASFTGSMYVRSSVDTQVSLSVQERMGSTAGSSSFSGIVSLPANQWVRLSATDVSTAAADGFQIWAQFSAANGNVASTIDATGAMADPAATLVDYFDGSLSPSPGGTVQYSWVSTADASASHKIKYTQNVEVNPLPDSLTINNEGDANSYPIIELQGPLSAGTWYIINDTTGETLTFDSSISSTQTLTMDMLAQSANIDGVPVDYYIRGTWLRLAPGLNQIRLVSGYEVAGATMRIRTYDTWS